MLDFIAADHLAVGPTKVPGAMNLGVQLLVRQRMEILLKGPLVGRSLRPKLQLSK